MVSPNQSMQQAVGRLLDRMRKSCAVETRLAGIDEMLYQSPGPKEITQGDTIHQWAQVHARPTAAPIMQWTLNGQTHTHQADNLVWDEEGILPRLCAAQRLLDTTDSARHSELALQYQLVTKHTNFILVHERTAGEKAQDLPMLQQIAQMQAAGANGYGTVILESQAINMYVHSQPMLRMSSHGDAFDSSESLSAPTVWRTNRTQNRTEMKSMSISGMDDIEIPAFLRKQPDSDDSAIEQNLTAESEEKTYFEKLINTASSILSPSESRKQINKASGDQKVQMEKVLRSLGDPVNPLVDMLQKFNAEAINASNFRAALSLTLKTTQTNFMTELVMAYAKELGSPAMVWACLILWLADSKGLPLERHARRLIDSVISKLDPLAKNALAQQLDLISGTTK
jgi:hypothetical protein